MTSFWQDWWGTVVSPRRTVERLSHTGLNSMSYVAYGLFPALYTGGIVVGYLRGATPDVWRPWVSIIPLERYYLWEAIFLVPLSFQLWITFAALAHLLARAQYGRGAYESTLAVFAYTYSVPLIVLLWLPDQLQSVIFGVRIRGELVAIYGSAAGVWTLVLCGLGLRAVYGLSILRGLITAAAAGVMSYVPAGLLLIR